MCVEGRAWCVRREGPGVCRGKGPVYVEGRAWCVRRDGPGVRQDWAWRAKALRCMRSGGGPRVRMVNWNTLVPNPYLCPQACTYWAAEDVLCPDHRWEEF